LASQSARVPFSQIPADLECSAVDFDVRLCVIILTVLANALSLIALLVSTVTFGLAQHFQRAADRRSRIPVLVFDYDPEFHWRIRNVGNGPALNIDFAIKKNYDDEEWQHPTRIPPIARDSSFSLTWLGTSDVDVMAAAYEDFLAADTSGRARTYTVLMTNDKNQIVPRRELPAWDASQSMTHWERQKAIVPH
jgi:hypothetical protein